MSGKHIRNLLLFLVAAISGILLQGSRQVKSQGYLSPETVIADKEGRFVYTALREAGRMVVVDAGNRQPAWEIDVPAELTGLVLSPEEDKLYITGRADNGKLFTVDLEKKKIAGEISAGHSPVNPVISPDGKFLYIPDQFGNRILVVDLTKGKVSKMIPVAREPVVAALTHEGKKLFIAHFLPDGPSDSSYVASSVSVINTSDQKVSRKIRLPNGSTGIRAMALSPDGKTLYITHVLGRFSLPTTQLERGWMNTNAFTLINTDTDEVINTILLDDVDLGAANPWGAAVNREGDKLIIAHAGTNELSIIQLRELHDKLGRLVRGEKVSVVAEKPEEVVNDLTFLLGIRDRISLRGKGPRGVAVAGNQIFVAEFFSGTLGTVDMNIKKTEESISLGREPSLDAARKGYLLFNDATKCFQHWQSCASCHPDARADGLNWDLQNDGMGNHKNTKSLLLSHQTPPVMGHGIRASAEVAVRSGFKYILFTTPVEEEATAVDQFLKNLPPGESPLLAGGKLSKTANEGKQIFLRSGCANCHSGPHFTNLKSYDVGTLRRWNKNKEKPLLDVPTLIEVWRTAPYLHDGRARTVDEAFKSCHPEGVRDLSPKEIKALTEYVLSL